MKRKYEKILFEANKLALNVQKLNRWGSSATVGVYVTAYEDFSQTLEYLRGVIQCIEELDGWDKCVKRFGKDIDFDRESISEEVIKAEKRLDTLMTDFRGFIEERTKQKWN